MDPGLINSMDPTDKEYGEYANEEPSEDKYYSEMQEI